MRKILCVLLFGFLISFIPSMKVRANVPAETDVMSIRNNDISCYLDVNTGYVNAYLSVDNLDVNVVSIEANIEFQEKSGLFFRTIETEHVIVNGRNLDFSGVYATTAGNKYRIEATITVYYSVGNDRETVRSTVITGI